MTAPRLEIHDVTRIERETSTHQRPDGNTFHVTELTIYNEHGLALTLELYSDTKLRIVGEGEAHGPAGGVYAQFVTDIPEERDWRAAERADDRDEAYSATGQW